MFRAAHRSSSVALNSIYSLWFIYPCGDRPTAGHHRSKHVEPSINFGIINSITKLHLVGISTESPDFLYLVLDRLREIYDGLGYYVMWATFLYFSLQ